MKSWALSGLVEKQSADYIGKQALAKIKQEGVKKRMIGIKVALERTALWMEDAWPVYKRRKASWKNNRSCMVAEIKTKYWLCLGEKQIFHHQVLN